MKLYAVFAEASKPASDGGYDYVCTLSFGMADGDDDAKRLALTAARREWPEKDGWAEYDVMVAEVPHELMVAGLTGFLPPAAAVG